MRSGIDPGRVLGKEDLSCPFHIKDASRDIKLLTDDTCTNALDFSDVAPSIWKAEIRIKDTKVWYSGDF